VPRQCLECGTPIWKYIRQRGKHIRTLLYESLSDNAICRRKYECRKVQLKRRKIGHIAIH
jgi:hypothetical protein